MIQIFDNIFTSEVEDLIENEVITQHYRKIDNLHYIKSLHPNSKFPELPQYVSVGTDIKGPLNYYLKKIMGLIKQESGINFGDALRWKINKLSPIPDPSLDKWGVHVDQFIPHYSIIYYVNDIDGDTIFYNNTLGEEYENFSEKLLIDKDLSYWEEFKRVSPKKGRVVIFDGKIFHRSSYPTKGNRYIINFVVDQKSKKQSII